jgi:hypothetical protein
LLRPHFPEKLLIIPSCKVVGDQETFAQPSVSPEPSSNNTLTYKMVLQLGSNILSEEELFIELRVIYARLMRLEERCVTFVSLCLQLALFLELVLTLNSIMKKSYSSLEYSVSSLETNGKLSWHSMEA